MKRWLDIFLSSDGKKGVAVGDPESVREYQETLKEEGFAVGDITYHGGEEPDRGRNTSFSAVPDSDLFSRGAKPGHWMVNPSGGLSNVASPKDRAAARVRNKAILN